MTSHDDAFAAESYDFILVGAGSASCLIASRLSSRLPNHRILVLEAGEHVHDDPKVLTPGLSPSLLSDPKYDWQYISAPERGLGGRRIKQPRGKLVGGSSAINSHSVVFPNHEWQDRIAEELLPQDGREDWGAEGMKECYSRWEVVCSEAKGEDDGDGLDRVKTSFPRILDQLQTQWTEVFAELGHKASPTGFAVSSAGGVNVTNAVDSVKAERSHAGTAFLDPALQRGNVQLKTGVKVDKIVFDKAQITNEQLKAKGIQYTHHGQQYLISGGEIVLCAGIFESPAILERSGIGSRAVLAAAHIPVLYELPGVGENLQDHLNCSLSREVQDHVPTHDKVVQIPGVREAEVSEYQQSRSGRLAEGAAYSYAFTPLQLLETQEETQELVELVNNLIDKESNPTLKPQYSVIQKAIENPEEATATTFLLRMQRHKDVESMPEGTPAFEDGNYVTIVAMLAHPFSRGSCHITSSDFSRHPEIKFNYLSHPLDAEILARHMRLSDRLFQQPAFTAVLKPDGRRFPRSFPHPITSVEDAKGILAVNSATNYHPCGTCSMMREELGGVVDGRLKVYGTSNVRVCDASVLPIVPRGNILTAVYAFAEKAAEIIIREAMVQTSQVDDMEGFADGSCR